MVCVLMSIVVSVRANAGSSILDGGASEVKEGVRTQSMLVFGIFLEGQLD
jgi:hypothetical protein